MQDLSPETALDLILFRTLKIRFCNARNPARDSLNTSVGFQICSESEFTRAQAQQDLILRGLIPATPHSMVLNSPRGCESGAQLG
jgi:hypothetical protein